MQSPDPEDFLSDPLSSIARLERRNLLIASSVGFLVATAGLVPTNISALGISLSVSAQGMFVIGVALVIAYFICAFAIYGTSDFYIWRKKYQKYLEDVQSYMENWDEEDQHHYDNSPLPKVAWLYQSAGHLAYARAFFEYGLPLVVGIGVIATLLARVWCP
ncbi:hypothetical protein FMN52_19190 [Marinobacter sp. BW6]|uniref:hypothetical protein n=1 Tax=Marinobacter sp. BW6 TaxID=2592624 RepID=UPI0011DE6C44|nr:hypothetical protein [Marinobacter sp. BW6]TYC53243.1 hypothetical protein FMN52_19190 [Marinobacter sp. BW6]